VPISRNYVNSTSQAPTTRVAHIPVVTLRDQHHIIWTSSTAAGMPADPIPPFIQDRGRAAKGQLAWHDNQAPQNAIWPASEAPIVSTYLEPLCRTLRLLADEEVKVQQNRHFEFEHRCALIPRLENIHKVITCAIETVRP
jgi:hypothetical protein